ncbi:MAG: tripartite tricarboxylate transporter substrate-binding protein [Betaproteobacteria bacterium]
MTGEVDLGFYNMPTVIGLIKENQVRALAVTSLSRSKPLPELPTLDEAGVKGYEVDTWFGYVAPAGTPADAINRLHHHMAAILALPAVRDNLAAQGINVALPQANWQNGLP